MRLVICGSRSIKGEEAIGLIDEAVKEYGLDVTEVISGEAEGVDAAAIEWAERNAIEVVKMPANWKGPHRKGAGYKRNTKMAWYADMPRFYLVHTGTAEEDVPEVYKGAVLAIWNGTSRGTKNMMEQGEKFNLPVFVKLHQKETTNATS